MTAPGTRRHIFDKKLDLENCDTSTVSLQMGTNKMASQQGMTSYGQPRQVYDNKYCSSPGDELDNGEGVAEFDGYHHYSDWTGPEDRIDPVWCMGLIYSICKYDIDVGKPNSPLLCFAFDMVTTITYLWEAQKFDIYRCFFIFNFVTAVDAPF